MQKGIKEQIQTAKTVLEIDKLLKEAQGYKYASTVTRRRWQRVANARCKTI